MFFLRPDDDFCFHFVQCNPLPVDSDVSSNEFYGTSSQINSNRIADLILYEKIGF